MSLTLSLLGHFSSIICTFTPDTYFLQELHSKGAKQSWS